MKFVCLWSPGGSTGGARSAELGEALLEVAPRVRVERRGVIWVDARGFGEAAASPRAGAVASPRAVGLAESLLDRLEAEGVAGVRAGLAAVPIAAELAARSEGASRVVVVRRGEERSFLAPLSLLLLEPSERLAGLLAGAGLGRCGELAALDAEAVEVRFGEEGERLWRLARADDRRLFFAPIPRQRPRASLDFVDYVLTGPARLVFTANALLGGICEGLQARGEHARGLRLRLGLANGGSWEKLLVPARPTASRERWLALIRLELERLTIPDAVTGMVLEVQATEPRAAIQGDLFDQGFASAGAVEVALSRLVDRYGPVLLEAEASAHALAERRLRWKALDPGAASAGKLAGPERAPEQLRSAEGEPRAPASADLALAGQASSSSGPRLALQLLREPRPIQVATAPRRDHTVPVRYRRAGPWCRILTAAGPDRLSGERWGEAYAREYYRCTTEEGELLWIFHDACRGAWFLHGWWD